MRTDGFRPESAVSERRLKDRNRVEGGPAAQRQSWAHTGTLPRDYVHYLIVQTAVDEASTSKTIIGRDSAGSYGVLGVAANRLSIAEFVEVIAPPLVHCNPLFPVEPAVVSASNRIRVNMR